jgi:hypothetical protein
VAVAVVAMMMIHHQVLDNPQPVQNVVPCPVAVAVVVTVAVAEAVAERVVERTAVEGSDSISRIQICQM